MQDGDLDRIHRPVDWLGLNHYGPICAKADASARLGFNYGEKPADVPRTPMGWPIVPKAFGEALRSVAQRYRLPIYVLENGLGGYDKPDEHGIVHDVERVAYLAAYISAMNEAAADVDVRGYFVWSLLDNFEWDYGYSVRFGLNYVDYASQKRIPKSSFRWYADLIQAARAPH
jgi:beta-glucosidase